MSDPVNLTVFLLIVASRLAVPLLIPRYPLPAIIVALVLDGIDGGLLAQFSTMSEESYQSFDKALDIYYLTLAYLSTMRNWTNVDAVNISQFLIYYRLLGVLVFEFTEARWILLVFPNTFEYFFIFYEIFRLRWNPARLTRTRLVAAVAAIWILIKLPQEYWLHVAQLDLSDTLLENPPLIPLLAVVIVGLALGARWMLQNKLPPRDHDPVFDMGNSVPEERLAGTLTDYLSLDWRTQRLPEKVVLVSIVSVIFSEMLPETLLSGLELTFGIAVVIIANTAVTEWLSHRRSIWFGMTGQFGVMALINIGILIVIRPLLPTFDSMLVWAHFIFFLFLVTLLITLFDLFMSIHQARDGNIEAPVRGNR